MMVEYCDEIKNFPNGDTYLIIKGDDRRIRRRIEITNLSQEEIKIKIVNFFKENQENVPMFSRYLNQHPDIREKVRCLINSEEEDSDSITSIYPLPDSEEEDEPKTQKEVQKEPEPKQKLKSKAQKPKVKQIIKNGDHTEINFYFSFN